MNKNEISEIRRRLNPEKNNITCIRGCYVDSRGNIISKFNRQLISMPQTEAEKYMAVFKRLLSGTPGRNLTDVPFDPAAIAELPEHQTLMHLRETALMDDEAVDEFCEGIIGSVSMEGNYVILMLHDAYDVPHRHRDDVRMTDDSDEVFNYILLAICPVKPVKTGLAYDPDDRTFRMREEDWVISAPDVGFMFPSFDDRASNICTAVYYCRDASEPHEELTATIFNTDMPLSAPAQRDVFNAVLEDALTDDLSYDVIRNVNDQIREMLDEQKKDREAGVLTVSKREVCQMLENCGLDEDKLAAFEERYDQEIGTTKELVAATIVEPTTFRVRTPDVVINVAPDRSDLIETRIINGMKYILIPADEGVEVNGVNIKITE